MADRNEVRVGYVGDASDLARASRQARGEINKTAAEAEQSGRRMGRAVAGGAVVAGTALLGLAKATTGAASMLNESLTKSEAVFGSHADSVKSWAYDSKRNILLTRQAAIEGAATFGNLFTAMGTGQGDAAKMSTQLVTLAGDLSSFNNVGTDEALLALRAGLVGEAEPLRRFGVQLNAARIEAEAYALGLAKPVRNAAAISSAHTKVAQATAKLTEVERKHGKGTLAAAAAADGLVKAQAGLDKALGGQRVTLGAAQKAAAAYSIILKDTAVAQGDAARTADGDANSTRILKKNLSDLSAELGQKLLPAKVAATQAMSDLVTEFENGTGRGGEIRDALANIAEVARDVGGVLDKTLVPVLGFIADHAQAFTVLATGVAAYRVQAKLAAAATELFALALGKQAAGQAAVAATGGMGGGKGGKAGLFGKAARAVPLVGTAIFAAEMYDATTPGEKKDKNRSSYDEAIIRQTGRDPRTGKIVQQVPTAPAHANDGDVAPRAGSRGQVDARIKEAKATAKAAGKANAALAGLLAPPKMTSYKPDGYAAALERHNAALDAATKRRAAIVDSLGDLQDRAASSLDKMRDFREGVSSNAKGYGALGSLSQGKDNPTSPADIARTMREKVGEVRAFAKQLQSLAAKGLSPDLIRQFAEMGPGSNMGGLAGASKAEVAALNAQQAQLASASAGVGRIAGAAVNGKAEAELTKQTKLLERLVRSAEMTGSGAMTLDKLVAALQQAQARGKTLGLK